MPPFEAILFFAVFALLAVGGLSLLVALRSRSTTSAVAHLEAGDFRAALEVVTSSERPRRDELLAAARAARNLAQLDLAARFLDRLLTDDPEDGEAWLETALTRGYARDIPAARQAFDRVSGSRSDLLESLTLHRAWLELFAGDANLSRRLFDEVEVSLETKLRDDLGDGDPAFAEWFLHAGWLWRGRGDDERAGWALGAAIRSAPNSVLPGLLETWWRELAQASPRLP